LGIKAEPIDGNEDAWMISLDYVDFSATLAIELKVVGREGA
jgi:hypothetical protein